MGDNENQFIDQKEKSFFFEREFVAGNGKSALKLKSTLIYTVTFQSFSGFYRLTINKIVVTILIECVILFILRVFLKSKPSAYDFLLLSL